MTLATRPHFVLNILLRRLPLNVTVVPEIKRFLPPGRTIDTSQVELSNGTVITGINTIIFATGFRYTFPFLPQYHNSSVKNDHDVENEHPRPIVTDGTHLRALYLDIFYIEEPTLGFVDMNIGMQSFTYGEYIGVALTKVWAGTAHIPNTRELWRRQEQRVNGLGGYGKHFQFLGTVKTQQNIRYFLGWLNAAAVKYGGRQIDGINPENEQISATWSKARFGNDIFLGAPANLTSTGCGSTGGVDVEHRLGGQVVTGSDLVDWYNDAW
ncbi:hypothetical protein DXG03_006819 [Asterophora parasitica]|uniref:Monooxygenase n=1 Tax=Asterophora parasitica TaxID=117018 RepID=A0A9P7FYY3_9AGAR|nr:hypothetical protein DXG03_006819 [Asterophora parasitica]